MPFDYEQWRRDHPRPASKLAADLNAGEPRMVRMIYFLPNDRPYRQEVVDSMKTTIRQIQTLYAEQMQAHRHVARTFRFETDAQGAPLVHRVDGQHPDSHYLDVTGIVYEEIDQVFDLEENIYLVFVDNTIDAIGIGGGRRVGGTGGGYKKRGSALVPGSAGFGLVAHELGHAFGLLHDFRDDAYLMSYGEERERLSACAAEFLEVHPYFNSESSLESDEDRSPTVQLISPAAYPADASSVPIQLKVADSQGLHQVILFAVTRDINAAVGGSEIKACRGLSGERDKVVEFAYDGTIPSSSGSSLSDPVAQRIRVQVVNSEGDVRQTDFVLSEVSPHLVATLEGHTSEVNSLAFSPDGTLLASSGSWDREIKLWQVNARQSFATLRGHTDAVRSVSFSSPDGATLASGSLDRTIKLWDGKSGGLIATLEEHTDGVTSVSFSSGGNTLASGSRDGTVRLWDLRTREVTGTLEGHTSEVTSVSFSPDGALLASTGGFDRTVRLWDVGSGKLIATLEGHTGEVTSVSISPDGATVASGSLDRTVRLWDVETREQIAAPLYGHSSAVTSVSYPTPDASILASASWDGTVILWDLVARKETAAFGHTDEALSVSFAVGGAMLAAGWRDGTVLLWDTSLWTRSRPSAVEVVSGDGQQGAPGAALAQPLVVEVRDQYGNPLPGAAVTFTVTAGEGRLSGRFAVQDATADANGRAALNLTLGPDPGLNTVGVFIGGRELRTFAAEGVGTAVVEPGGDHRVWHLPPAATVRLGKGAMGQGDRSVALSADGRFLAVASAIGVWLYEAATSRALALLPTASPVHSVAFSLDGTMAAGLENGWVELLEVETGERIGTLMHTDRRRITSVVFSPDGTRLASGALNQGIKLWDVETRRQIGTWEVPPESTRSSGRLEPRHGIIRRTGKGFYRGLTTAPSDFGTWRHRRWWPRWKGIRVTGSLRSSFSPNGTLLASTGGFDRTVRLWDAATHTEVATLRGHINAVYPVSFSPDGAHLASGGGDWDHTVVLWDVVTEQPIATLRGHAGAVRSVTFSPDGAARLVSGSEDGSVLFHDLETGTAAGVSGHEAVSSLAFSADGALLATGNLDGTAKVWDAATRRLLFTLKRDVFLGHPPVVKAVSFSPDGSLLATGQWYVDHPPTLWDVGTGERIGILKGGLTSNINTVSFSPDGALLATGSWDGTVRLWDVATREAIGTLNAHDSWVLSVSFSPDGALLATGSWDETVKLWDVVTRSSIATLQAASRVYSMAFSPDGKILVSGEWGTVRLWDVGTREWIGILEEASASVRSVAFSSDGATLASAAAWDGTFRLWNVATREEIATIEGHRGQIHSLAFLRDDNTLASGASDGTMLLWDIASHLKPRTPDPDFDRDGTVGFADFVQFAAQFGLSQGDEGYDARFDLDGNGAIGFGDFLIFAGAFGKGTSSN